MPSTILRYQAVGSYGGHLLGLRMRPNMQQPLRRATTTAKPRTGRSVPPKEQSGLGAKTTRFASKSSRQDFKTSQSASARSAITAATRTSLAPTTSAPSSTKISSRPSPTREPEVQEEPQKEMPFDPKSKEYKQAYNRAARRYTALMVSVPLLFVTSYYLFKRLAPTVGARPPQSQDGQPSNA